MHSTQSTRMAPSRFIGQVGGLAVALGIGTALAGTGMATAQAESRADNAAPNVSVSARGAGFSSGSAHATSEKDGIAVAVGSATAGVSRRASTQRAARLSATFQRQSPHAYREHRWSRARCGLVSLKCASSSYATEFALPACQRQCR